MIPDECDASVADCNLNGIPDDCDIASGTSLDFDQNGLPDECQSSGTFHVPGDFETIAEAVNFALDDSLILVADGTYGGTNNCNISFRGKALTLMSENGPENCILDCDLLHRAFEFTTHEGPDSVLEGFTIKNGGGETGGAILIEDASPTIRNCVIVGARSGRGGGIYAIRSSSVVENCQVVENVSLGNGGGIQMDDSTLILRNTIVVWNLAFSGGSGVHCESSSPEIRHCSIANNAGIGLLIDADSVANIHHCILWGNFIQIVDSLNLSSVTYCDVSGGWIGKGNLDADPIFQDPSNLDFHIQAGSPCIDAGDAAFVPVPGETDIDGEARVRGTAVDIGADEF